MSDLTSRSESYMNDLIRRGDVLALFPMNDCSDKMIGLYERVLDISTAYDVEKVVEELEEKQHQANKDMQISELYEDVQAYGGKYLAFGEAIEIVKAGGVDG